MKKIAYILTLIIVWLSVAETHAQTRQGTSSVSIGSVRGLSDSLELIKVRIDQSFAIKWDSAKAVLVGHTFGGRITSKGLVSSEGLVSFSGNWVQMMDTYGVEMPEIIGFPNTFGDYGTDKQAIMNRGGSAGWDFVGISDVTGLAADLAGKQATLISGSNIKTIEGNAITGPGNIDLSKSDVGLANVDNTSDLNKPLSTAAIAAFAGKQNVITGVSTNNFGKWNGSTFINSTVTETSGIVSIASRVEQNIGNNNTSFGFESLKNVSSGTDNTSFGYRAMREAAPMAAYNVAYGKDALGYSGNWQRNVAIGYQAGIKSALPFPSGSINNSIYIGHKAEPSAYNVTNELVVGPNSLGNGSNTATFGNSAISENYFFGNLRYTGTLKPSGTNPIPGQVLTATTGNQNDWEFIADTLNGRAILNLPDHVANLIPKDHHLVIESDYLAARSSGNSYFDTLRLGYYYYNILKDSVELVLPLWDTSDIKNNLEFNITYHGWDNDSAFNWVTESSYYKKIYSAGVLVDSVLTHRIQSILYFSQPINYDIYRSDYLAHNHPNYPFRLPEENNPTYSFILTYDPWKQKYYLK